MYDVEQGKSWRFTSKSYLSLSIHLDKPFANTSDLWFSSSNKINGISAKNWIMKNNITGNSKTVILTDNFLMGNLIREIIDVPLIGSI